ncbi:MAG: hypothetical protein E6Q97_00545 [Desulfurellales bacterium]|nr:MAG: hypothetical protein E6Q97_00545 [Desulfurellales bacterium]
MTLRERIAYEEAESLPRELRREFDAMVADGNKPQFALACILQEAPSGKGNFTPHFGNVGGRINDQAFVRSAFRRMNTMNPRNREKILKIAQRAGINTEGKAYCGQLGGYSNPMAWCSTAEDVLESCKRQNLSSSGAVEYKAHEEEAPIQGKALAPDIVKREAKRLLTKDPDLAAKVREGRVKKQEVAERVVAKHAPKKRLTFSGR